MMRESGFSCKESVLPDGKSLWRGVGTVWVPGYGVLAVPRLGAEAGRYAFDVSGFVQHMKRVGGPNEVRFLTFSCYERIPLFENDRIKDLFVEHLARGRAEARIRMIAWVVMPEHVHLLVLPLADSQSIPAFLNGLKRPFAQKVIGRWRELGAGVLDRLVDSGGHTRFWQQGGGYDRVMRSTEDVQEKTKYIHENPVRRGLVDRAEDWRWSSAHWHAGRRDASIPIDSY
jgi:putative transposase